MSADGTYKTPEISTPDTPASGFRRFYAKIAGWFDINSLGTESKLLDAASNLSDVENPTQALNNLGGQPALGFTPENVADKATDFSVVNNTKYPSVQAVKTYADGLVVGLLDDRGSHDASGNAFPYDKN